ncbi:Dienelactone hydrolase [Mycena kentingensis (nom. inval.)]|nr:Dienelactone hydrolase [Mycena kentingensis (nom. inval.)]
MSTDPVLASAPRADCCIDGVPHTGTSKGQFMPIAEVNTYVSHPPTLASAEQHRILLYFPDVWGIDQFQNGQLLCDYFAANGFLVTAIDYFRGVADPVTLHRKTRDDTTTEPGFDYEAWKAKHQAFAAVAVPKWIEAVKEQFGTPTTKYACVGYCFGAPYVMDALAEDTDYACVGAFGHPAFLNESHFNKCSRPLLLSCAETDHTFPVSSRIRAEELLTQRAKTLNNGELINSPLKFHIQLFSGVAHGFSLRGNMDDPWERFTKDESANGIIRWFKLFMG